jgi:hypothetical protein
MAKFIHLQQTVTNKNLIQKESKSIFDAFIPGDGCRMFLLNIGIYLQVHTMLEPRKPTPTNKKQITL